MECFKVKNVDNQGFKNKRLLLSPMVIERGYFENNPAQCYITVLYVKCDRQLWRILCVFSISVWKHLAPFTNDNI